MGNKKYIKDLPLSTSPSFDGYFVYDNGVTTYKGTLQTLYNQFSPLLVGTGRTVTAGNGLIGGGNLGSNITLNVATGNDGITINSDNITLNTVDNLTTSSSTQPLSSKQGKFLWDNKVSKSGDTMTGQLSVDNNIRLNGNQFIIGNTGVTDFYVSKEGESCLNIDVENIKITNFWNTHFDSNVIINESKTPTGSTYPGIMGEIAWDINNFYVCVSGNTWKKTLLTTF